MAKPSDRRPDSAIAEDVAEFEQQLWEFAKRPNPPQVPEAALRPGAFLYRMHKVWNSLGRGTGIASHSFRALKDELQKRDPPVRNLQPKLYGNAALSHADAVQLIDVMLKTWRVTQTRIGSWQALPLWPRSEMGEPVSAARQKKLIEKLTENLLHTLFQGEDSLLLEEPVGVAPEVFLAERGRLSAALIIPSKPEPVVHLSPSAAYGGFSLSIGQYFAASIAEQRDAHFIPLLIWIYRLPSFRDNAEFHHAFHALTIHSAALTNWYLRLSRVPPSEHDSAMKLWSIISTHSAFVVYGLAPVHESDLAELIYSRRDGMRTDLLDLDLNFFLPQTLPLKFASHRHVRPDLKYSIAVSVDRDVPPEGSGPALSYWLFPERPRRATDETAETTGLPVFGAETSPGSDFDLAYSAIYKACQFKLGFAADSARKHDFEALQRRGWRLLTVAELQRILIVPNLN